MIPSGRGPYSNSLLLVGGGRLARHLNFYFREFGPLETWNRSQDPQLLRQSLERCGTVALAISDDAILPFRDAWLGDFRGKVVHFSGALHDDAMIAAHPLMTFGPDLYEIEFYRRVHFVMTGSSFPDVFPGLPNSWSLLPAHQKPLYHAQCVMGGNFPGLLFAHMESELCGRWDLPREAVRTYIERACLNYLQSGSAAVTGPLIRRDLGTVEKNINALEAAPDRWSRIYRAFKEVIL